MLFMADIFPNLYGYKPTSLFSSLNLDADCRGKNSDFEISIKAAGLNKKIRLRPAKVLIYWWKKDIVRSKKF